LWDDIIIKDGTQWEITEDIILLQVIVGCLPAFQSFMEGRIAIHVAFNPSDMMIMSKIVSGTKFLSQNGDLAVTRWRG
jgi:hypothetical protein